MALFGYTVVYTAHVGNICRSQIFLNQTDDVNHRYEYTTLYVSVLSR